jgi:hypothetical protein
LPLVDGSVWLFELRRRWRGLSVHEVVFLPQGFLWGLRGQVNGGPGYVGYLWAVDPYRPELGTVGIGGMVERVGMNLARYANMHVPILLTWNGQGRWWLSLPLVALAVAGWARRLKRPGLAEAWVPAMVSLLLLWPAIWGDQRFALPLLPVLLARAAEALRDGARLLRWPAAPHLVPLAAAAVLLGLALPGIDRVEAVGRTCRTFYREGDPFPCMTPAFHEFFELAAKARGTLPPGSTVLSRKASIFFVYSGYRGRTYPLSTHPDSLYAEARRIRSRYLVLDGIDGLFATYMSPVLAARHDDFCVMGNLGSSTTALLRIEPGSPAKPGSDPESFPVCGP